MLALPPVPGGSWTETILADFPPADSYRAAGTLAIGPGFALFGVTEGSENTRLTVYALIPPATSGAAWSKQVCTILHAAALAAPPTSCCVVRGSTGTTDLGGVKNGGTGVGLGP
jgi:hypothetical protein